MPCRMYIKIRGPGYFYDYAKQYAYMHQLVKYPVSRGECTNRKMKKVTKE